MNEHLRLEHLEVWMSRWWDTVAVCDMFLMRVACLLYGSDTPLTVSSALHRLNWVRNVWERLHRFLMKYLQWFCLWYNIKQYSLMITNYFNALFPLYFLKTSTNGESLGLAHISNVFAVPFYVTRGTEMHFKVAKNDIRVGQFESFHFCESEHTVCLMNWFITLDVFAYNRCNRFLHYSKHCMYIKKTWYHHGKCPQIQSNSILSFVNIICLLYTYLILIKIF